MDVDERTDELDPEELAHQREMDALLIQHGLKAEDEDDTDPGSEAEPEESDSSAEEDEAGDRDRFDDGATPTGDSEEVADSREDGDSGEDVSQRRVRDAQARMTRAAQEAAEYRRELEDLRMQNQQLAGQMQMLTELLKARETGPQKPDVPKPDPFSGLLEDLPEVAPLVEALRAQTQELGQLRQAAATFQQRDQDRDAEAAGSRHESAILSVHPDAQTVATSDAFGAWLQQQPPVLQRIAEGGEAADVNWLLSQYKASRPKPAPANGAATRAARAAAVPNLRGQSPAQRNGSASKKVPFSSIQHLPNSTVMQRYPDENMIDWAS
jgi:hypothetical protein